MALADQNSLDEAMNRLWAQFLPQIEQRVATLERAAAAIADGSLTAAQCEQASAAAHKLAGVLGTFGLAGGTLLARQAEAAYSSGCPVDPSVKERLAEAASQLRSMVAARK